MLLFITALTGLYFLIKINMSLENPGYTEAKSPRGVLNAIALIFGLAGAASFVHGENPRPAQTENIPTPKPKPYVRLARIHRVHRHVHRHERTAKGSDSDDLHDALRVVGKALDLADNVTHLPGSVTKDIAHGAIDALTGDDSDSGRRSHGRRRK